MLAAAAGYFCLLCGYYMLRPIREALALEVGVHIQLHAVPRRCWWCPASLLPIYWWLVRRTPRGAAAVAGRARRSSLVFLALAFGLHAVPRDRTLAFVYFVALTSANLLPDLGVLERDGGRVASGARQALLRLRRGGRQRRRDRSGRCIVRGAGASSSGRTPLIVRRLRCSSWRPRRWCRSRGARCAAAAHGARGARCAPFRWAAVRSTTSRVWPRTPYLLGIAGMIIVGQTIGAFMYNEQGKYVAAHVPRRSPIAPRCSRTWRSP